MKRQIHHTIWFVTVLVLLSTPHLASAYYDPGVQRWINRDPMEETGGRNLYVLTQNASVMWIDPYGLAASPGTWDGGDNNCCNYAYNLPGGTPLPGGGRVRGCLQPGELRLPPGQSVPMKMKDCLDLYKRVKTDFPGDRNVRRPGSGCAPGYHKVRMWLAADGTFAHMTRQDSDGNWSQKPDRSKPPCGCPDPDKPQEKGDQDCGAICIPDGKDYP
jgi:uncharacterized protein RhaS with RHS repeats